jgi:hypothetical protein
MLKESAGKTISNPKQMALKMNPLRPGVTTFKLVCKFYLHMAIILSSFFGE